jgi:hypothetical protein
LLGLIFLCSLGDEQQMVMTKVRAAAPMALQEHFSQSKISYLLFPNLTHKTEIGTRKGGRLLIATHLHQSNHLANQQQVLGFAMPFASLNILCKNTGHAKLVGQNYFAEANQHCLTFLHRKLFVQCTGRVALAVLW